MRAYVRWAQPSDVAALIELSLRTTRASYAGFLGETAVEAFIGTGAVDGFVRETIGRALVVTFEGEVAGYAVGTAHHVDLLMIDERLHRQGLGTLLLARLEEHLFRQHDAWSSRASATTTRPTLSIASTAGRSWALIATKRTALT